MSTFSTDDFIIHNAINIIQHINKFFNQTLYNSTCFYFLKHLLSIMACHTAGKSFSCKSSENSNLWSKALKNQVLEKQILHQVSGNLA